MSIGLFATVLMMGQWGQHFLQVYKLSAPMPHQDSNIAEYKGQNVAEFKE